MKTAAGIVTERGGRTSHAAIVARELGIPALVGAKTRDHASRRRRVDHGLVRRGRDRARLRGDGPVRRARRSIRARWRGHARRSCSTSAIPSRRSAWRSCRATASGSRGWSSSSRAGSACTRSRSRATRRCPRDVQRAGRPVTRGYADKTRVLRRPPLAGDRDDRRGVPPAAGDPPLQRLQDERVREARRRRVVRAERGEPDARLARREPLLPPELQGRLPARGRRREARARGVRAHEPEADDSVLPHARGRRARARDDARGRARSRRARARGLRDGRDPFEHPPRRSLRRDLRRLLDRLERPHAAHARCRSRLDDGGAALRRAERSREVVVRAAHRGRARARAARSASAARRRATTRTSRPSSSSAGSTRSASAPTRWFAPRCACSQWRRSSRQKDRGMRSALWRERSLLPRR